MNRFISIISKLKYLGLLGLPMFFSDAVVWRYFWLFWIFGIIEIILTWQPVIQALYQLVSIPYIYITHGISLPDINTHKSKISYSLPFKGRWTAVNGGVDEKSSHSWGIPTQRYAYDFIIIDENGKSCSGDPTKLENYYCYGKEVLAPADGVVVALKDNCADSKAFGNGKTDPNIKDIRGNYIVIKHADREYSVVAHLMPCSIKVKRGQHVKRGEYIACCGNSGNTSEPHVHFQVQDGKSFFASAGLPVIFDGIKTGITENYDILDSRGTYTPSEDGQPYVHRGQHVESI